MDIIEELQPTLPEKYAPIQRSGRGNQGVYLARVPDEMASVLLRHVEEVEREAIEVASEERSSDEEDDAVEGAIRQDERLSPTEKLQLVSARRGQGVFRTRVERIELGCRVSGLREKAFLVASHIKPWRVADNAERLDGSNGLLLAPHVDKLFDRGYLTFEEDGTMRVSDRLPQPVLRAWGIPPELNVGPFTPRQAVYLAYHRAHVFQP